MPGLNLLSWREQAREEKKKQFFTLVGVSAALAAAGVFGAHYYMQSSIEHQEERNQYLTTEIAQLDKQIKEIAKRERKAAKEAQSQNNTESPAEQNAEQNTEQDAAGSQGTQAEQQS